MKKKRNIFLLIDGHALIYRAFYAFPALTTHEGVLVNAVYGFTRILLTAIRDFSPTYLAVAFDHPKPTFRHEAFKDYKAHREKMPDDLIPQIELIKQVVQSLNVPTFEKAGFEADDLIGTISCQSSVSSPDKSESERVLSRQKSKNKLQVPGHKFQEEREIRVIIVTGDKDLLQLVNEHVHVWIPGRGKYGEDIEYDAEKVEEKMGVRPDQIIDLKALMGDSSDNIPGVKGVGKITAEKLIDRFGSIEELFDAVAERQEARAKSQDSLLKGALLKKLTSGKEDAFSSKELVTIHTQVPIELDLENCRVTKYDKEEAAALLKKFDFASLIPLLPKDSFERGVEEALF